MDAIIKWCGSDKASARLTRTIFQGIIGVLITYIADLVGLLQLTPEIAGVVTAACMAVLSPIQAWIGKQGGDAE